MFTMSNMSLMPILVQLTGNLFNSTLLRNITWDVSFRLKLDVVRSSQTEVNFNRTTWPDIA